MSILSTFEAAATALIAQITSDIVDGTPGSITVAEVHSIMDNQVALALDAMRDSVIKEATYVYTSNITKNDLYNGNTVGSYTLATGDIVLLTAQTTGSENGLWLVGAASPPTRPTSYNTAARQNCFIAVLDSSEVKIYRSAYNSGSPVISGAVNEFTVNDDYSIGTEVIPHGLGRVPRHVSIWKAGKNDLDLSIEVDATNITIIFDEAHSNVTINAF